ncbi:MAG: response regulator transcription factor [Thiohalocapsa sp. PB-PSB1]|jgi:DNA-binding response OmpR family regulator|nr:MAG: hypothetical protein N838_21565 [Thiohalocapsa sp. PB-PSB1]QQO52676.1 MAG: response regulator transcription factor [Thiohalocapsa sp. PB-PSB1]
MLFHSVLGDMDQKLRGFEAGCVNCITKPFDSREVLAGVSAHLQQRYPPPTCRSSRSPPTSASPAATKAA